MDVEPSPPRPPLITIPKAVAIAILVVAGAVAAAIYKIPTDKFTGIIRTPAGEINVNLEGKGR